LYVIFGVQKRERKIQKTAAAEQSENDTTENF
jgi:hypothetical protein